MRPSSRYLLPLLGVLGALGWLVLRSLPSGRSAPTPDPARKALLASVAGEEDPGAAVDSPAPPRHV